MKTGSKLLRREMKFAPVHLDSVKLDGRFSGYASVFDKVDQGNDMVVAGAFKESLKGRNARDVRMLFQHDPDQPIGVWKRIVEDKKGLLVEGQITTGVRKCDEVLELMRAGAIDGLSIGFRTKRAKTNPSTKIREILSADLWEISVVTFPLLEEARIETIKSATNEVPTKREFERWLTRDAGLSRSDARRMISGGYSALACKHDAALANPERLAENIRRATYLITKGV